MTKLSAPVAVEEGMSTAGGQYVRTYTFSGRKVGLWQEVSLADGVRREGRFTLR